MKITNLHSAAIATSFAVMLTAMAACTSAPTADVPSNVLAKVGEQQLTEGDVRALVPSGLSADDSLAFVSAYVNKWVDEQLLTEVALKELGPTDEIDRLTEQYRRQLIMWEYRRLRCSADTALAITASDIADYYEKNREQMRLSEPLVRGVYIKIEEDAKRLPQVRKWYKSEKPDDIDRLEKVGLENAIHYDYFRSTWIPWKQVANKIPTQIDTKSLRRDYTLDFTNDGFTYLLHITEVLPSGSIMPLAAAEPQIRRTLEALRLNALDARLRADLRQRAADAGELYVR